MHLLIPVVLLGLVDSLNPTTIAVAIYLATTRKARARLSAYIAGVFTVYFLGGVLITLGPGRLLQSTLKEPRTNLEYGIELAIGIAALAGAYLIWRHRDQVQGRELPKAALHPASTFGAGALMTLIDLPTAVPLLAAIGLMLDAQLSITNELILLAAFCLFYILPLVAIAVAHEVMHARAEHVLQRVRLWVEHWAPVFLAGITVITGVVLIYQGVAGLR